MSKLEFKTLAEVQAHQFTGAGGNVGEPDYAAFEALHVYLQTDAPFAERAEALNHAFIPYTGHRDDRDPKFVVTQYLQEWVLNQEED